MSLSKCAFLVGTASAVIPGFKALAAVTDRDALQMSWAANQDELSGLVNNPALMQERFHKFMNDKYGTDCETAKVCQAKPYQETQYLAFQYNVQLAHERNLRSAAQGTKVVHGITNLMDETPEQFQKRFGYKPKHTPEKQALYEAKSSAPTGGPDPWPQVSVDWREKGAVTDVKDQGQCGSCWAFSTVESIESAALVQGLVTKDDPFIGAPQELVSCDKGGSSIDNGCNGGLPEAAFKYLKNTPLEPESAYPYNSGTTKVDGRCKLDKSQGLYEVDEATQLSIWGIGETDMANYIETKGPMSVAVHANSNWQTYKGGVLSYEDCTDDSQPNHAVQAVAVNSDGETPYWVIRNSWAAGWGEDGFIRIEANKNTCNVAFEGFGVTVKKADETV